MKVELVVQLYTDANFAIYVISKKFSVVEAGA